MSFTAAKVSPDGNSVVIATEKADWEQQIFRKELWLYRTASASLTPLTQSGHDTAPQWSPDGQWIAFLSERKVAEGKDADTEDGKGKDGKEKEAAQLFLISPNGGEAFAITSGDDEVHGFAWSPRFEVDLLCHPRTLDQAAERRSQERLEGRDPLPRR